MKIFLSLAIVLVTNLFLKTTPTVSAHRLINFSPPTPSTAPPPPSTTEPPFTPPIKCPLNKVPGMRATNHCAPNCKNLDPHACTLMYKWGCDPEEGFAFVEGQDGPVIPVEMCPFIKQEESTTSFPPSTEAELICPPNMVPGVLAINECAPSCENLNPVCTQFFSGFGCDPAEGYAFFRGQSGGVVPRDWCILGKMQ